MADDVMDIYCDISGERGVDAPVMTLWERRQ